MKDENGKHTCSQQRVFCYEEDDMLLLEVITKFGDYEAKYVNYCPWCGFKAKKRVK